MSHLLDVRYICVSIIFPMVYFVFEFSNFGQSQIPKQIDFETIIPTSKDPMQLFIKWRQEAMTVPDNKIVDAMTLATVKPDGSPSARNVLLRGMDNLGYKIYADYRSPKGQEIEHDSRGALVFLWRFVRNDGMPGGRQVRVERRIEKLSTEESQAYFDSEPILSQIRATYNQTQIITDNRASIRAETVRLLTLVNQDPNYRIPKPPQWGGYRLRPDMMEFYEGLREGFISDRVRFRKQTAAEQNGSYEPGIFPGENGWVYFQVEV